LTKDEVAAIAAKKSGFDPPPPQSEPKDTALLSACEASGVPGVNCLPPNYVQWID